MIGLPSGTGVTNRTMYEPADALTERAAAPAVHSSESGNEPHGSDGAGEKSVAFSRRYAQARAHASRAVPPSSGFRPLAPAVAAKSTAP
jgi:hypothetical protein